jgi:hypothetical protein
VPLHGDTWRIFSTLPAELQNAYFSYGQEGILERTYIYMIKICSTIFEQNNTIAEEQYNKGTTAWHYDSARTTKRELGQSTWPSLTTRTRRCTALRHGEPDFRPLVAEEFIEGIVADCLVVEVLEVLSQPSPGAGARACTTIGTGKDSTEYSTV